MIEHICKNCRNLAPNVMPENKCISYPWAFVPTDEILLAQWKYDKEIRMGKATKE